MNEFVVTSPQHSDIISEDNDVSSNKETSLLDQTNHHLQNNFKTAYVSSEKHQKPIIRGRKTFAFWTLVMLLFLLAIGNLVLTMTILGVLRLGNGMQSIELLPEDKSIKLFGDVDLGRIYKQNGILEGFEGENMDVTADDSSLLINLYSRVNRVFNKLKIDKNHTCFNGFSSFDIKNKRKQSVFNVANPTYNNLKNVNTFKAKSVTTNKIRSKLDENLKIEGDILHLKGNEGLRVEAREIVWSADEDIYLRSINGSIVLSGKEGTYVDIERLPLAKLAKTSYVTAQFKICVCMPQGKLFRVPVANARDPVYCHQADMSAEYNPCMDSHATSTQETFIVLKRFGQKNICGRGMKDKNENHDSDSTKDFRTPIHHLASYCANR